MTADTEADADTPVGRLASRAAAPPTRRRGEDGSRNKVEIIQAAVRVFSEKGYAATTLEAVARLVGLTRQGVLHHFPSKEVLFAAVIADQDGWARRHDGQQEPVAGVAEATPDVGASDGLRGLAQFLGRAGFSRQRLQMVQVLQGEAMSGNAAARTFATHRLKRVRAEIGDRIARGRQAGQVRPDVDATALATLVSAAINGLQAQWLLDTSVDTAAAFDVLLTLVGTAAPDGAQDLDNRLTGQ